MLVCESVVVGRAVGAVVAADAAAAAPPPARVAAMLSMMELMEACH